MRPLMNSALFKYFFLMLFALLVVAPGLVQAEDSADEDLDDTEEEVAADYEDEDEDEGEEEEGGAEYEADYYHPLSEMPEALADVSVGNFIVSHPLAEGELEMEAITEIAVGDKVEVLCGMRNAGDETLHISFMTGSLNNPYDFGEYLTNFSEVTVNRTIAPHSEVSLDYKFDLPEFGVRVGPYIIALTVFYAAGEGADALNYSNTFFNETIVATEAPGSLDSKTFFTLAIILTVGFVFFHMSMKKKATQKAAQKTNFIERDHETEMEDNVARHVRSTGAGGASKRQQKKKK